MSFSLVDKPPREKHDHTIYTLIVSVSGYLYEVP